MTGLLSETNFNPAAQRARTIGAAGVLCELHGRPFDAAALPSVAADPGGLDGVVAALRQLGLDARAERCSAFALGDLALPVLALMETGDCVLVLRTDEHSVLVCATQRPALQSLSMEQFLHRYAGQVVRIGAAAPPARRFGFPALMHRWLRPGNA